MMRRTPFITVRSIRPLLGVALLLSPSIASGEAARGGSFTLVIASQRASDRGVEPYRLTAAVIEKVSAIMNAWNPQGPEPMRPGYDRAKWKQGTALVHSLAGESSTGKTTLIEHTPALKSAVARAGLTPREFSAAFYAYITAQDRIRGDESAETAAEKQKYGSVGATGVAKANIDLMRSMQGKRDLWSIV